jgi:hypothetical protein
MRRGGRGGGGNEEVKKTEKEKNHDTYCLLGCDAEYKRCFG